MSKEIISVIADQTLILIFIINWHLHYKIIQYHYKFSMGKTLFPSSNSYKLLSYYFIKKILFSQR